MRYEKVTFLLLFDQFSTRVPREVFFFEFSSSKCQVTILYGELPVSHCEAEWMPIQCGNTEMNSGD